MVPPSTGPVHWLTSGSGLASGNGSVLIKITSKGFLKFQAVHLVRNNLSCTRNRFLEAKIYLLIIK